MKIKFGKKVVGVLCSCYQTTWYDPSSDDEHCVNPLTPTAAIWVEP